MIRIIIYDTANGWLITTHDGWLKPDEIAKSHCFQTEEEVVKHLSKLRLRKETTKKKLPVGVFKKGKLPQERKTTT